MTGHQSFRMNIY